MDRHDRAVAVGEIDRQFGEQARVAFVQGGNRADRATWFGEIAIAGWAREAGLDDRTVAGGEHGGELDERAGLGGGAAEDRAARFESVDIAFADRAREVEDGAVRGLRDERAQGAVEIAAVVETGSQVGGDGGRFALEFERAGSCEEASQRERAAGGGGGGGGGGARPAAGGGRARAPAGPPRPPPRRSCCG